MANQRTSRPPRRRHHVSLAPDVIAALDDRAAKSGEPISRLIDAAVRRALKMPEPMAVEKRRRAA